MPRSVVPSRTPRTMSRVSRSCRSTVTPVPGQVAGQQVGHELGDRRGVGEDADVAGVAVGLFLEVVLQVVHLAQDHARMLQQALAGGRDLHAPAVAVQQAGIELVLQRLDALTAASDRWARLAPASGWGFGDVDEQAEVGQIEVHAPY